MDLVAASILLSYVVKTRHRVIAPEKVDRMMARMSAVASSPAIAIIGAGAVLANPGAFIPLALKVVSETDPTASQYVVEWITFSLVSLLPLAVALILLVVARSSAEHLLATVRDWLIPHAWTVGRIIVLLLALALLRNGISGLAR